MRGLLFLFGMYLLQTNGHGCHTNKADFRKHEAHHLGHIHTMADMDFEL